MADGCLLIGDLGVTNARFALAEPGGDGFTDVLTLNCDDFETPDKAIAAYLQHIGGTPPEVICLAAAGPIVNGVARFLNNHWVLDSARLANLFLEEGGELIVGNARPLQFSN